MFDNLLGRQGSGGFLSRGREETRPRLEKLEDRDVPAVIGGIVYNDANCNGLLDVGERGIANSTMQLFDASNRLIATTVTNANGEYQFTQRQGPTPGPGEVSYEFTFEQARTNRNRSGTVPLFDANLGTLTSVEIIAEGSVFSNVVMENLEESAAEMEADLSATLRFRIGNTTLTATPEETISGTLNAFDGEADLQGDSARDFGITELAGSFNRVVLTSTSDLQAFISSTGQGTISVSQQASATSCACGTGNLLAMIRSTTQGKVKVVYHYQPNNEIGPGSYTIVQSSQPRGFVDGHETKDNLSFLPGSNRTDRIQVGVVSRTEQLISNHFGEVRANSSISGNVYHDVNRNGRLDAGDQGLAGVVVHLTGTDMCGNTVNRTTTTNAAGAYSFARLVAGNYTVREIQPSGYLQGTTTAGNRGGQVNGDTIRFNLSQNTAAVNYNFGEILNTVVPPPPITGVPPSWNSGKTFFFGGNGQFFGGGFTW